MAKFLLAILALTLVVGLTTAADPTPNLERALVAQQEVVAASPFDPQAYNDLGNLYALAGRDDDAEAAYRRALELDPRSTAIHFNLAVLLQQQRRLREAQQALLQVLEIDPRHAWTHYQLGMLAAERGQRSKAIEHYARAFAYDPQLTFPRNNPHIIDNRLSTEALLVSQRYREAPSAKVPRQYADPARITELLLYVEDEPEVGDEADPATEPPAEAGSKGAGPAADSGGAESGGRASRRSAPEVEPRDGPEEGGNRVITREDVEEEGSRVRGLAVGVGQPAAPETRRDTAGRGGAPSLRGSTGDRPQRRRAPTRTGVAPSRPRYQPGIASTGRLDLELLPQDEDARYAAARRR